MFQPYDLNWHGIRIGEKCIESRIITHELLHALGLQHEHQRKDRDNYIEIQNGNILEDFKQWYSKEDYGRNYGIPYNVMSLMHYKDFDNSRNGQPTITLRGYQPRCSGNIGSANELGLHEELLVRKFYECSIPKSSFLALYGAQLIHTIAMTIVC